MESSTLEKIERVKMLLTEESNGSALSGNAAELREDLDQAKTQIVMTESLLKALSPSDSLEIFTKLEVLPAASLLWFRFIFSFISDGLDLLKLIKNKSLGEDLRQTICVYLAVTFDLDSNYLIFNCIASVHLLAERKQLHPKENHLYFYKNTGDLICIVYIEPILRLNDCLFVCVFRRYNSKFYSKSTVWHYLRIK